MPTLSSASPSPVLTDRQVAVGVHLPSADVRRALDAAVRRGWSEQTRRLARVVTLLLMDTLAGLVGVALVRTTWWIVSNEGLRPLPNAMPLVAMVFCIQPLALRIAGAYGGSKSRASLERVAFALAIAAFVGWIQALLFAPSWQTLPNKTAYIYSAALISLLIWFERVAFDMAMRLAFSRGLLQRRVLLIAHREELEEVQRRVDHTTASDVRIVGALSPRHLVNGMKPLDVAIESSHAHAVVVAATVSKDMLDPLIRRCLGNGIGISLLPSGLQDSGVAYFELRPSDIGLLLQVFPMRFGLPQLAVKRAMDVAIALGGIALTWPVFVLISCAIKMDSVGPVLFRQTRVGVGGKTFRMLKFRTMHVGADEIKADLLAMNESGDPRLFKIRNDPRVTRVGHILRRFSLDELPQIFNVLKGEMSLVGPRPFFLGDLPAYETHHFERLHVLPGITGLWQVSGRSDVTDFEEVVRLDREYIRNWSVLSDLSILLKTVSVVFGRGAY